MKYSHTVQKPQYKNKKGEKNFYESDRGHKGTKSFHDQHKEKGKISSKYDKRKKEVSHQVLGCLNPFK